MLLARLEATARSRTRFHEIVHRVLSAKVALLYVVPVRRGVTAKEALATAVSAHQERLLLEDDLNVFPASQENTR